MKLLLDNYDNLVPIVITLHFVKDEREVKVHTKVNNNMIRPSITRKVVYPIVREYKVHTKDIYTINFVNKRKISVWLK